MIQVYFLKIQVDFSNIEIVINNILKYILPRIKLIYQDLES